MIGRVAEQRRLREIAAGPGAEFVVVYGRRRVGKTYLVRETFAGELTFTYTGVAKVTARVQLAEFVRALREHGHALRAPVTTWFDAFAELRVFLEDHHGPSPLLVFLDELPWMDNRKSDFLPALEHFWNGWASGVDGLVLIACGSATSWITKKVFRNTGGLYNRVTQQIRLRPFTLGECKALLESKGIQWNIHDIIEAYMVFGGIPYYLNLLTRGGSLAQAVDATCFAEGAPLAQEFDQVFATLFADPAPHVAVVRALATRQSGLTRADLVQATGLADGGNLTRVLTELEQSDFVRQYRPFGRAKKGALWQLADPFTGFYLTFMEGSVPGPKWAASVDSAQHRAWSGYAFEQVCLGHLPQMRRALGISGVRQQAASWRAVGDPGTQVDLVIDRNDGIIDLCEMKYAAGPFVVDKSTDQTLRTKAAVFRTLTATRKAVQLVLVTPYGLVANQYAAVFQACVTAEDLLTEG